MQRIILFLLAGGFLGLTTPPAKANSLLVTNMGATGAISIVPYAEYEWSFYYLNPQVQITGIELVFAGNLMQSPHAIFRDGDGNGTGILAGSFVRNEGSHKVYQFNFGSSMNRRSEYYAVYNLNEGSSYSGATPNNPIGLVAVSGTPPINYDATVYSGVNYSYWTPSNPTTDGNTPLFSFLAIPEPSSLSLLVLGMGVLLRRSRKKDQETGEE